MTFGTLHDFRARPGCLLLAAATADGACQTNKIRKNITAV